MADVRLDHYDLKELALETGAQVTYPDGKVFNTAGLKGGRKPAEAKVSPAPTPEPKAVEPPKQDDRMVELMRQMLALLNRPVEVKLPEMPTPNVVVNAPEAKSVQPTNWVFEFERNPNGTIKRINATSAKSKLN